MCWIIPCIFIGVSAPFFCYSALHFLLLSTQLFSYAMFTQRIYETGIQSDTVGFLPHILLCSGIFCSSFGQGLAPLSGANPWPVYLSFHMENASISDMSLFIFHSGFHKYSNVEYTSEFTWKIRCVNIPSSISNSLIFDGKNSTTCSAVLPLKAAEPKWPHYKSVGSVGHLWCPSCDRKEKQNL